MLLIRPETEQTIRNRIFLFRQMPTEGTGPQELEQRNRAMDEFEKSLDQFKNSEDYRKVSKKYWSDNDVQLSTMGTILQELTAEADRIADSLEKADKLGKSEIRADLNKRKNELTGIMAGIFQFAPAGEKTWELIRNICENWEKIKGTKNILTVLKQYVEKTENDSAEASKRIEISRKKLTMLQKNSKGKGDPEVEELKKKMKELEEMDSGFKDEIRKKKAVISELQASLSELNSGFRKKAAEIADISKSGVGSDKSLSRIMLSQSIPLVRSAVEAAAKKIPREILVKRQNLAIETYEQLRAKYEGAVIRAKNRSRCKRCREMIDLVLSGAVDHGAPHVGETVSLLEQGDMREASKELKYAFDSGSMHEYVRAETSGIMKELMGIYDEKGEISGLEDKLRKAGSRMFRTRLDLMKLDYIASGVHSGDEIWFAATETLEWMESVGMVFEEGMKKELEEKRGNIEFLRISDTSGFTKDQAQAIEEMMEAIGSERALLEKIGDSEAGEEILKTEAKIASIVTAEEIFENPVYLKSLASGDPAAVRIRDNVLERAGEYAEALEMYLDSADKKETITQFGSALEKATGQLSKIKGLCDEIGSLKNSISKAKPGAAVSLKITLGRKIKELEDSVGAIVGGELDQVLVSRISEPKLGGEKLYSEIVSHPAVGKGIRKMITEQGGPLFKA